MKGGKRERVVSIKNGRMKEENINYIVELFVEDVSADEHDWAVCFVRKMSTLPLILAI